MMATCLALVMLAVAFAYVAEPQETDAVDVGDTTVIGSLEYLVVDASKRYTDSSLGSHTRIFVMGVNGNTAIAANAFSGCTKITDVHLDDRIRTIGREAFADTPSLSYIYANSVTTVQTDAFRDSGLDSCWFSGSLTALADGAFRDTYDLKRFQIEETSVTSLGPQVFAGSGLEILDLRNMRSIDPDAFTGSELTLQVVRTGQEATVDGVDRIYFDGDMDWYEAIRCIDGRVTVVVWYMKYFSVEDLDGNPVTIEYADPTGVEFHGMFTPEEGVDYILNQSNAVISFPDDIGLEETRVVLPEGTTSYELPDLTLGDMRLLHWTVDGAEVEGGTVDGDMLRTHSGHVDVVPVFSDVVLTLDHSGISGLSDTSGLDTRFTYTYRGTYPDPGDVTGYAFDGWMVGETKYSAGDPITDYTAHTAKSLWVPSVLYSVVYTDASGTEIGRTEHGYNQRVNIDTSVTTDGSVEQRFIGWSLDGTTVLGADHVFTMTEDVVLKPVFETRAQYKVTFLVDGETHFEITGYDGREVILDAPVPETETAIFKSWKGGDGGTYMPGDTLVLTSDTTMTAEWRNRESVPITFLDGDDVVGSEFAVEGLPFTVELSLGNRDGMIFDGWTTPDGERIQVGGTVTVTTEITLTASYREPLTLTVTYVTDGAREVVDVVEGTEHTVLDAPEAPKGQKFTGWVDSDGSVREPGDTVTVSGSMELTARFEPLEEYTVTVLWPDGQTTEYTKTEGEPLVIPAPEDSGTQIFVGWEDTDGKIYGPGEGIDIDSPLELKPVYRDRIEVTFTYLDSDGSTVLGTEKGLEGVPHSIGLVPEPRDGSAFVCWRSEGVGYTIGSTVTSDTDRTFTAEWRPLDTYEIVFVDGSGETFTDLKTEGRPYTVERTCPDTDTRIFDHWTTDDGTVVMVGDVLTEDADARLTAVFHERGTFSLTFMDGETVVQITEHLEGVEFTVEVEDPVSDGKVFVAWVDQNDRPYRNGDMLSLTSDLTLTAQWRAPDEFTVLYKDGDSTLFSETVREGETTIAHDDPVSKGRIFLGWMGPDGTVLHKGDSVMITEDVVLTAQWRDALAFEVTFVVDGKTYGSMDVTEGAEARITIEDPLDPLRKFLHWTDGASEYHSGDMLSVTGDTVLTAVWADRVFHTVTYHDGSDVEAIKVENGSEHVVLDREDTSTHWFSGWAETDGGNVMHLPGTSIVPTGDMDLYAVWERIQTGGGGTGGGSTGGGSSGGGHTGGNDDDGPADPGTDEDDEPTEPSDPTEPTEPDDGDDGRDDGTAQPSDGDGTGSLNRAAMVAAVGVVALVTVILAVMLRRS